MTHPSLPKQQSSHAALHRLFSIFPLIFPDKRIVRDAAIKKRNFQYVSVQVHGDSRRISIRLEECSVLRFACLQGRIMRASLGFGQMSLLPCCSCTLDSLPWKLLLPPGTRCTRLLGIRKKQKKEFSKTLNRRKNHRNDRKMRRTFVSDTENI